ncbi:hypothetical protein ACFY19_22715 [Streptosporangium saharense]|uniref:hypothetical protein n=1 Tax=Streptosporangium saharense TaxID=1706840 RepID=UPI0036C407E8
MEKEQMDTSERRALSMLCDELPALRALCAVEPEEKRSLLSRIETEARTRGPILELLGELLGTGVTGTERGLGAGLPGAGAGRADEESFGCPDHACDRIADTVPAGPVPRCQITGLPMRRR